MTKTWIKVREELYDSGAASFDFTHVNGGASAHIRLDPPGPKSSWSGWISSDSKDPIGADTAKKMLNDLADFSERIALVVDKVEYRQENPAQKAGWHAIGRVIGVRVTA